MKCVTPMFREYIEYTPEQKARLKDNGTKQFQRIVPREEVAKELSRYPNAIRTLEQINEDNKRNGNPKRWQTIPCKKCYACRLNYSAEWATRITCECKNSEHNYFITLTYDDNHLPIANNIILGDKIWENTGAISWFEGTLWEEHWEKFKKDLRNHLQNHKHHTGMQYYMCGEYGENTHRPHYHAILMNCPLDVNQFYDFHIDERYKMHWKTPELEKLWPNGMIDVAEVEWSCIAYVARYCTKKLDFSQDKRVYLNEGRLPEKVGMSKGIGFDYFRQHKDEIYKNDEIIMKTVKGNTGSYKPPKAFDRKLKELDPKAYDLIRASRQKAGERAKKLEKSITDMTDLQMLRIKAENVANKMSMLPRVGEW